MSDYNLIPKSKVEKDCLEWCPLYYQHKNNELIHKSKIEEKIKELSEGIKRDLENQAKVKDESWKKAIGWSRVQKSETKKVLQELLEEENNG